MAVEIHELRPMDCEKVAALWDAADAAPFAESMSAEAILRFLRRNPNLALVARDGKDVVGAVLCHEDAAAGRLHHVAVSPDLKDTPLADELIDRAVKKMTDRHRSKSRIALSAERDDAEFWDTRLWRDVPDLRADIEQPITEDPEDFQRIVTQNPATAGAAASGMDDDAVTPADAAA